MYEKASFSLAVLALLWIVIENSHRIKLLARCIHLSRICHISFESLAFRVELTVLSITDGFTLLPHFGLIVHFLRNFPDSPFWLWLGFMLQGNLRSQGLSCFQVKWNWKMCFRNVLNVLQQVIGLVWRKTVYNAHSMDLALIIYCIIMLFFITYRCSVW